MRKYELSPTFAAAMRNRAMAAPFREAGIPLYLELPIHREMTAPSYVEFDAEDSRVEAESFTIGGGDEDDDDFY